MFSFNILLNISKLNNLHVFDNLEKEYLRYLCHLIYTLQYLSR